MRDLVALSALPAIWTGYELNHVATSLADAMLFTPKGGKIQVCLERISSHVEVSVSDTGQSIVPEFLPHVFDRFRQADSSTTRRYNGLCPF
jgi:signal transduction histidine kinase